MVGKKYEAQLTATRGYLRFPRTAADVAAKFEISMFAAYERLAALKARGAVKRLGSTEQGPSGKTGPKARLWQAD